MLSFLEHIGKKGIIASWYLVGQSCEKIQFSEIFDATVVYLYVEMCFSMYGTQKSEQH